MILSYRFRLYPTKTQKVALETMLGAFCDLYNAALEQRITAYQRRGVALVYHDQALELKAVRASDECLGKYSFSSEQQVLRRLNKTFTSFFRRIKRNEKPGFPRFKSKTRFDSAEFRFGDGLTIHRKKEKKKENKQDRQQENKTDEAIDSLPRRNDRLSILGIPGHVKVKWHREFPVGAKIGAAVVRRQLDRWFVCFQFEIPDAVPTKRDVSPVGIDLGLSSLVALSTGETVDAPRYTKRAQDLLCKAQKSLSRKRRGSKRREKARRRVARLHGRVANQRRDFSHKLSKSLVQRFTHLAFEDLNIKGLARGMHARSVHDAAWSQFLQHVRYKAESAGSIVCLVDPRKTSQTCPECDAVVAKTLSDRVHACSCGCTLDRDVAAARVILKRANFTLRPGHGHQPSC